jgi:hypothetical protein
MKTKRVYYTRRKRQLRVKRCKKGGDAFAPKYNNNIYRQPVYTHTEQIGNKPEIDDKDVYYGIELKKKKNDKCSTPLKRAWNWLTCRRINKEIKSLGAKYGYGGRKKTHRRKI